MSVDLDLLYGIAVGLPVGLSVGLRWRRVQIRHAREDRIWAGWRAVCAQAAANRHGAPERLP